MDADARGSLKQDVIILQEVRRYSGLWRGFVYRERALIRATTCGRSIFLAADGGPCVRLLSLTNY
jgi:hypothetical protein